MGSETYGTMDFDAAAADRASLKSGGLKLRTGRNVLRFLPPAVGQKIPFVKTWIHWVRDVEAAAPEKKTKVGCPKKLTSPSAMCHACAEAHQMRMSTNRADQDSAWRLDPKLEVHALVIDVTDVPSATLGAQQFTFGKGVYDELLAYATDPTDPVDFTHPVKGVNVIIEKVGEGPKTKYKVRLAPTASALSQMKFADGTTCEKFLADVRDLTPEIRLRLPAAEGAELLAAGAQPVALPSGAADSAFAPPGEAEAAPAWWGNKK